MKTQGSYLQDVITFTPTVHVDYRGYLFESFKRDLLFERIGREIIFVQENETFSNFNVLRGMHYQLDHPQGKLVSVPFGEVWDVVLDLRRSSSTFGQWAAGFLNDRNHAQVWIPPGFAHGFLTTSARGALVQYKISDNTRCEECSKALSWCDPTLKISWPLTGSPILSQVDVGADPFDPFRFKYYD